MNSMSTRDFLKAACAGAAGAALAGCSRGGTGARRSGRMINWRLQTYAGSELAKHVVKPAIDAFNKVAEGRMHIDLYCADQLVPTSELFSALMEGTVDVVQSDDDSMSSAADVRVFGGYFPFASRYSLDVPVLFSQYGLDNIWAESYKEASNGKVTWLSAGSWDPCHFATKKPIHHLEDLKGLKVYTFPTAGRFLSQFGVVPVTLPYEDAEMALRTGTLDGVAWSGITEDYTVGWADACKYFVTNSLSGAWIGSFFVNTESWNAVPDDLKELFKLCMDSSHYYRQYWYWGGEADLRVNGGKLELCSIPDEEWKTVEEKAVPFWEEIASSSPRAKQVVEAFRKYNAVMAKAGKPYRY